jgi:hypothetical protein
METWIIVAGLFISHLGAFIFGMLFGRKNAKIADKVNEVGKDVINKVVK